MKILRFKDYIKSIKVNENKDFTEMDYKNMLNKYFIFKNWFGKNNNILEELFTFLNSCFDKFFEKIFPYGLPKYEDYEQDEYQQIFVEAIETIRDYITEENDWFYSKYYTIQDYLTNQPPYPQHDNLTRILGEMLNIYMHEVNDCYYKEWE